jgi:hypothetical protein|nr:MAG TPA: IrrE protein [Caudoviricetes sp.]
MLPTSQYYAVCTLLLSHIQSLPASQIDVEKILYTDGWEIITYNISDNNNIDILQKINVWEIAKKRKGFTYKKGKIKLVFISSELSAYERLIILVHELAHIKLKHFSDTGILGYHTDNDDLNISQETEANDFILAFLAPSCILKKCGITDCDTIVTSTALDRRRAEHVTGIIHNTPRTLTLDEQALCRQFRKFIINHRITHYTSIYAVVACFLISIILIYNAVLINAPSLDSSTSPIGSVEDLPPSNTPTVSAVPSPPTSPSEEQVIITPSGTKYHAPTCPSITHSDHIYIDKNKAIQMGYDACLRCKP